MVAAVRRGQSLHHVAQAFDVSVTTVRRWVLRAQGQRLDRVDWVDRSHAPHHSRRTPADLETIILDIRRSLKETSDLGFYGAIFIREELARQHVKPLPSLRTINRVLQRHGAFDAHRRIRRKAPPPGWYLPDLAAGQVELDSFDIVEGLVIKNGPAVEVLNGVSVHGGLVVSWPRAGTVTAAFVVDCLVAHWREFGLPGYAQFDNDTVFHGPHIYADVVGRVSRLCLGLGVVPVFVPPRETGFQAAIEGLNGSWQSRVWARFRHENLEELQGHSSRHVGALRRYRAARIEAAPVRRSFPSGWQLDLQAPLRGQLVYLRRTTPAGNVEVLGQSFVVDHQWANRLVRVEVDLKAGRLRVYRLRRRAPADQPLLVEIKHRLGHKKFRE